MNAQYLIQSLFSLMRIPLHYSRFILLNERFEHAHTTQNTEKYVM